MKKITLLTLLVLSLSVLKCAPRYTSSIGGMRFVHTKIGPIPGVPKVFLDVEKAHETWIIQRGFDLLESSGWIKLVDKKEEADFIIKWEEWEGTKYMKDFDFTIWGDEVGYYTALKVPEKTYWWYGYNNKVKFLYLNTGDFFVLKVMIVDEVKDKSKKNVLATRAPEQNAEGVKNFIIKVFKEFDSYLPSLYVNLPYFLKTTESSVHLTFECKDNLGIYGVKVIKDGRLLKFFTPSSPSKRLSDGIVIPLEFGENKIEVTAIDWVRYSCSRKIAIIRTKKEGIPVGPKEVPELVFEVKTLDGDNTVVGGKEEGIRVVVKNKGKGIAKWVKVVLEGDEFLIEKWGKERNLEDIKPGETRTAIFSLSMPTEMPRRVGKIKVSVKEGRGYSPTEKPTLIFNLVPAEEREKPVALIEDVDHDIPKGKSRRRRGYALIIGLSKFSNGPEIKYARRDAETFSKYAEKVFGIPSGNIKTICDEKATVGTIKAYLTDWLKRRKGFKVIYFSGHGVPDPENPREGDVYLLPYDGDPELKSTLISIGEVSRLCSNPGDTVILFLDACFSGERLLAQRPLSVARIREIRDALIFAAAEGSQPAKEFERAKHGYFTYYLLLGLKGKADRDRDGWITSLELYDFVKDRVYEGTNFVQQPVLRPRKNVKLVRR